MKDISSIKKKEGKQKIYLHINSKKCMKYYEKDRWIVCLKSEKKKRKETRKIQTEIKRTKLGKVIAM